MPGYMLTEKLWCKLREILLQVSLYNKAGLRETVEGILFKIRTGMPWRGLPEHFGKWNSIYKAFDHWSKKGIWKMLYFAIAAFLTGTSNILLHGIFSRRKTKMQYSLCPFFQSLERLKKYFLAQ